MSRTVPVVPSEAPGIEITAAIWNAGPTASGNFFTLPPIFRGHQTSAQSTSSGSYAAMQLNASDIDSDFGHSNTLNNTRYICQVTGWYWVQGIATWVNSGAQSRLDAVIAKNGTVVNGSHQALIKNSGDFGGLVAEVFLQLKAGDYVELWGQQNTGGSLNTYAASDLAPTLNVMWIHA